MNKKTVISATDKTVQKLKFLAKKKEGVRGKLAVTAKKLAVVAEGKESVRGKLAVIAKKLAITAKEKENIRRKLVMTAKNLNIKAKRLAKTAEEREYVRGKLAVTAKQLAVTADEKENVRNKLAVTAKKLAETAEEKEDVRSRLAVTAETLRLKAKQLATAAKEKESVRSKLIITAETLRLKAKQLALTAKERESIRRKLEITAKKLATTAEEKEEVRSKLALVAKKLAVTAKEKESVRQKLAVTAKQLKDRAIQLAVTAKEKEEARSSLAVTAKQLAVAAEKMELANKELRSLDLAKDEFVSIASHQLRTPLTALKGYTGMLLDGDAGPVSDKQREYLTEIKNANDRMINLITALLNVSRVDLGVFVVEPVPVNLAEVAESVLKENEARINNKKLAVTTNFEKDLPLINADLNIMRMILQNLLSNAMKYTPAEGKIIVDIKKDGQNILISIADTGYGILENVQSKIFTKMFRADNARIKDPTGTGLGLYIIKETIKKTGGKIWFESPGENKGSTFYVTIPLEGMKKKEGTRRLENK
jgi:signal transduction histidine kinase